MTIDQGLERQELRGFEARLLPVLMEAMEEQAARRTPGKRSSRHAIRRVVAVAVVAAAVGVGTTVAVGGGSTIEVRASDALADPDGVARDLQEVGIEATILVVPVPPPMEGTWWTLHFPPGVEVDDLVWAKLKAQVGVGVVGLPEEILDNGRGVQHRPVLELPTSLPGPVTLAVGRAARAGDVMAPMENELAPNGAFWCLGLDGVTPFEARPVLEGRGYQVVWVLETSTRSDEVESPPPGSIIVSAFFRAPDVVDVRLASKADAERWRETGVWDVGDEVPHWAPECEPGA